MPGGGHGPLWIRGVARMPSGQVGVLDVSPRGLRVPHFQPYRNSSGLMSRSYKTLDSLDVGGWCL